MQTTTTKTFHINTSHEVRQFEDETGEPHAKIFLGCQVVASGPAELSFDGELLAVVDEESGARWECPETETRTNDPHDRTNSSIGG